MIIIIICSLVFHFFSSLSLHSVLFEYDFLSIIYSVHVSHLFAFSFLFTLLLYISSTFYCVLLCVFVDSEKEGFVVYIYLLLSMKFVFFLRNIIVLFITYHYISYLFCLLSIEAKLEIMSHYC